MANIFSLRIFPILLVNFLGILGYSLVIPILIFIVIDFGGNGFIYGLIGATYPLFQFIGAPRLGRLSDRIGRKKVLIITQLGSFVAWSLFFLALVLPKTMLWEQDSSLIGQYTMTVPLLILFLARIVDGYTGGNISVANAYLSDVSTDEDRSQNFGLMGSSSSLGFVIGPVISGLLAASILGELLPILAAAVIALSAAIIIYFRLSESVPCIVQTSVKSIADFRKFFQVELRDCHVEGSLDAAPENQPDLKSIFAIAGMPVMYLTYFLTFLGFSVFYVALPIHVSTTLAWTAVDLGIFLAYFSFLMILVQGPILARLAKKFSELTLIISGACFLVLGFGMLPIGEPLYLYFGVTVMALGNGIMWPSFLAVLSQMGNATTQGSIQGYGASMGSLASMFGLVLGGVLFGIYGTSVFAIAAALFLIIILVIGLSWPRLMPILSALEG